jgi:UDP-glucose 4-epimerase
MTKCLITGGAGFIGSHLVEECLRKGFSVIVLDNLYSGKRENLPAENPRLHFLEGDITDMGLLQEIRRNHENIDYLFHLAAIPSVTLSMEKPFYTHQVNFEGTLFLLDAFKGSGIQKFVFASSAAVYGDTKKVPVSEKDLPAPISPYGADKLSCEYFLKIFDDAFELPTVACRFFNVFGERQDPSSPYSGVISIFFDQALARLRGKDAGMDIYGDGKQTRDFIYVKDVVRACIYLAEKEDLRGEVFNVGHQEKITISGLARDVQKVLEVDVPVRFREPRKGEVRHSMAAIKKLMQTGFEFAYGYHQGLERLAAFLKNQETI